MLKEKIFEFVQQYKNEIEWKTCSPTTYYQAKGDQLFFEECVAHMIPRRYISDEVCFRIALRYKSRTEWYENHHKSCVRALKDKKLYDKCCSHMLKGKRTRDKTDNEYITDAQRFKKKSEWRKQSLNHYLSAQRDPELFKKCCKHFEPKWTDEEILIKAREYTTLSKWKRGSISSYNACKNKNDQKFMDQCCSHMIEPKIKWTEEAMLQEANKYNSISEWQRKGAGSYFKARKYPQFFAKCCEIFKSKKRNK